MPGFGFPEHGIVGTLFCLFSFHFRAEIGHGKHDLIERTLQSPLAILQIEEHAHTRIHDGLEGIGCFDLLTTEAGLFGHDEELKSGARLERVHQSDESGPLYKLSA
jgi:hypothetical protein